MYILTTDRRPTSHLVKFRMAVSLQRVIRSATCLFYGTVLGVGGSNGATSGWPNIRRRSAVTCMPVCLECGAIDFDKKLATTPLLEVLQGIAFWSLKTNQMNFHERLFPVLFLGCCLCRFAVSIATYQVPTTCNHKWSRYLQKCKKHFGIYLQRQQNKSC